MNNQPTTSFKSRQRHLKSTVSQCSCSSCSCSLCSCSSCSCLLFEDHTQPIPGLISCAGVSGRWGLLSHAQNTVRWLSRAQNIVKWLALCIGVGTGGGTGGMCPPKFHKLLYKLLTTLYVVSDCAPPIKKSFLRPCNLKSEGEGPAIHSTSTL